MKPEYDFSKGVRGKFYNPDAHLNLPVYLDAEVFAYLRKQAGLKGMEINQLVNDILRKDIALIESVK